MNELIERLSEQCYEHDQSWTGVGQRIFNKEKFARLLILECCDMVNKRMRHNNPNDCLLVLDIKEHFGVEE